MPVVPNLMLAVVTMMGIVIIGLILLVYMMFLHGVLKITLKRFVMIRPGITAQAVVKDAGNLMLMKLGEIRDLVKMLCL